VRLLARRSSRGRTGQSDGAGGSARRPPLPRAFWFLFGGMFVNKLGGFLLIYLVLYLTRERGFGVGLAGAALAAYGIGSIPASVCGGVLADTWGMRRTMVASLTVSAALTGLLGCLSAPALLVTLCPVLGFASDIYKPAAKAAVANVVPASERARAFGLLYWAANLGFSASAIGGGLIASRSFTALFLADAATSVLCALLLGYGLRFSTQPGNAAPSVRQPRKGGLKDVLADRVFIRFVLLCLAFWWVYFQAFATLPTTLSRNGFSPTQFGMVIAVNGVTVVLLQPVASKLIRRAGLSQSVAASAVFLGVGFGMFAWARDLPLCMTAVVIWTLGEIVFSIAAPTVVADLAPAHLQGRYQGVSGLSISIALVAGPAMGSMLIVGLGTAVFWNLCLAVGLAVAVAQRSLAGSVQGATRARLASGS
jgi:MFS family permease